MGYFTSFSGELRFSRPLTYRETQAMPKEECFGLIVNRERKDTTEGVLEVVTGVAIAPSTDDSMKAYDALDEMNRLAFALPDDVTLAGEIRGEGEEAGDVRRYIPDGSKRLVVELKPRLVWPDGYEEPGRG